MHKRIIGAIALVLAILALTLGVDGRTLASASPVSFDGATTHQSTTAVEHANAPRPTTEQPWVDICRASNPNVNGYLLTLVAVELELLDPASTGHAHIWVYCHYNVYDGVVTYGQLDKAITWHANPLPTGPLSAYTVAHQGWPCPQISPEGVVCNRSGGCG